MALLEDLLIPIPGDHPSGVDVRYDNKLLIYDKIKEARRQDDTLDQGDWQHDRKVADFAQVKKLAQEALVSRTKDLQLAAWLAEAMLRTEGFAGLQQGLAICEGLLTKFWDTLYPPIDDGDLELRAAPLDWLGATFEVPLKSVPLVNAKYDWFKYKESRTVGYEDAAQSDKEKETRQQRLSEGKLAPEVFDKAFAETPKSFYAQAEKNLDRCLETIKNLDDVCNEKFGDQAPALGKLKIAIEEVRHTVHTLLEKKRETEPDPVEASTPTDSLEGAGDAALADGPEIAATGRVGIVIALGNSEPPQRKQVIAAVANAAAFLRKAEPASPAPYLMMRGLRWGELRAAALSSNAKLLEAPPTELRQHIKKLALENKWAELLDTAENAMSLPCSRAWLDLQKAVVEACHGLGEDYAAIANAICSELKTLLADVPELLDAMLLDDTPAANPETKAWLKQIMGRPAAGGDASDGAAAAVEGGEPRPSWPAKTTDAYDLARQALAEGRAEKAFEIMHREIARQRSGRGKFQRTLQLIDLCVAAGKDTIAQPLLEDIATAIEAHKLDEWEERETVASALATLMKLSARVQNDSSEKQRIFERICRLDPVRAFGAE
jgi:type VI secretion system protein ImpA